MSRVYFHSPTRTAELRGSERAWLRSVAQGPAKAAWRLDGHPDLEYVARIIAMIPEVPDGQYGANYLHTYLRRAQEQDRVNKAAYARTSGRPATGATDHEPFRQLVQALDLRLNGSMSDTVFQVAGHTLHADDIGLNTALVAGADPVRLAAKIHGWCEAHAWVDGPDRNWLAAIIDEGLRIGVYRRGRWYADTPDGPKTDWSDQGWGDVTDLLRERDDEPVVMSYSVGDSFPNGGIAAWEPTVDDDWQPDWARETAEGLAEWESYGEAGRAERRAEHFHDKWYDLPDDEQWQRGMEGLRSKPYLQLTPESLGGVTFGPPVTVYDLLAPDRDERVRAAFAGETEAVAP